MFSIAPLSEEGSLLPPPLFFQVGVRVPNSIQKYKNRGWRILRKCERPLQVKGYINQTDLS